MPVFHLRPEMGVTSRSFSPARSSRSPGWAASDEQDGEERHAAVEPRSRQPQSHLQIYHPVQRCLFQGRLEVRRHVYVKSTLAANAEPALPLA